MNGCANVMHARERNTTKGKSERDMLKDNCLDGSAM